jgi:hypothetical protein
MESNWVQSALRPLIGLLCQTPGDYDDGEIGGMIGRGNQSTRRTTAVISLRSTATCLPTWRTSCNHRTSTVMRSWLKVSKRGWAHRQQTSLTQAHKVLFPHKTSASIPVMTMLRSSLSMYAFFVYKFFMLSLFASFTAHRRLLSE